MENTKNRSQLITLEECEARLRETDALDDLRTAEEWNEFYSAAGEREAEAAYEKHLDMIASEEQFLEDLRYGWVR